MRPKVCFVQTWGGGAIYNVMRPVYEGLKERGWRVGWEQIRDGVEVGDKYDLVHFNYWRNMPPLEERLVEGLEVPVTISVHHIHPQHMLEAAEFIRAGEPVGIHTADPHCMRQLQQHSHHHVTTIPYTFDWAPYKVVEMPEEFTAGYLGCDYNTKRFEAIRAGCQLAGVKCVGIGRETLNEEENFLPHQEIIDLYKRMSCYVVASYNDGGPLPPQEAMLCGRPVATTHVGMMPLVVKEGVTGVFHDGTPKGIAGALQRIKDDQKWYHKQVVARARMDIPSAQEVVPKWEEFFMQAMARA